MFCRQCGSELKEGAAFCSKCGYKVVNQADEKIEIPPPVIGTVCSKCGAPLKEGAAFCNACGASTAPAIDAPVQTEVPYEPPKEGQERVYTFKANQNGDTVFHFTHDTLVVNQSGNPDKSKITCVPYCVISQITYKTRKIFPAMLIVGGVVLLFLLLMLGISSEDIMSYPGTSAEEGKLGMLVVHGIRIALAIMLVVCVMYRRTELVIKSSLKYANTFDVNPVKDDKEKEMIMSGIECAYRFDVNAVKDDKEKEWEAMCNELKHLIHIKRTDEEKQNKTILTGIIAKDTKSNGMELLAHLQENAKRNAASQT